MAIIPHQTVVTLDPKWVARMLTSTRPLMVARRGLHRSVTISRKLSSLDCILACVTCYKNNYNVCHLKYSGSARIMRKFKSLSFGMKRRGFQRVLTSDFSGCFCCFCLDVRSPLMCGLACPRDPFIHMMLESGFRPLHVLQHNPQFSNKVFNCWLWVMSISPGRNRAWASTAHSDERQA